MLRIAGFLGLPAESFLRRVANAATGCASALPAGSGIPAAGQRRGAPLGPVSGAAFWSWTLAVVLGFAGGIHAAPAVRLSAVADGLANPVEAVNAADGSGRLFLVEQRGTIRVVRHGTLLPGFFLDLRGPAGPVLAGGERGLLGLAFHPDFRTNRAFYVFYTRSDDGALTIARYLVRADDPDAADPASGAVILTIAHPSFSNHNGGKLAFGPDGHLYIGTGDGGSGGDPSNNAQNLQSLLGKILRIAVNGGTGYGIPAGNPFAASTCGTGACPEIWAYGVRNPWRFSFDRLTGDLLIGDVGQNAWEEIDYLPAGAGAGANLGWRVFEGTHCFAPAVGCSLAGHVPPVIEYPHDSSGGFSVTGGYRYRGSRSPELYGRYVYGDFVSARVWTAGRSTDGTWTPTVLLEPPGGVTNISAFGEDESGELYILDYSAGRLLALEPLDAAGAARTFISGSGSDAGPCQLAAPCRSLAAAVNATAAHGEVVILDSADYGPVSIGKSVSIVAPDAVHAGISVPAGDGVVVNGGGIRVRLRGLFIYGQGGDTGIRVLQGAALSVENCTVAGMGGHGLLNSASGELGVSDSVFRGNGASGIALSAGRVLLDRVASEDNSAAGLQSLTQAAGDSIALTVRDSVITGNGGVGIDAGGPGTVSALVERSTVARNGAGGIPSSAGLSVHAVAPAAAAATVTGSVFSANAGDGVAVSGDTASASVSGNAITGNGGFGLRVDGGGTLRSFGSNVLSDNNGGGPQSSGAIVPAALQ